MNHSLKSAPEGLAWDLTTRSLPLFLLDPEAAARKEEMRNAKNGFVSRECSSQWAQLPVHVTQLGRLFPLSGFSLLPQELLSIPGEGWGRGLVQKLLAGKLGRSQVHNVKEIAGGRMWKV